MSVDDPAANSFIFNIKLRFLNFSAIPHYCLHIVNIPFVLLQGTTPFGFIFATVNAAMVPSYANIVDMHLVLLQVTTLFGFKCATLNIAMVPSYANIMDMHLV